MLVAGARQELVPWYRLFCEGDNWRILRNSTGPGHASRPVHAYASGQQASSNFLLASLDFVSTLNAQSAQQQRRSSWARLSPEASPRASMTHGSAALAAMEGSLSSLDWPGEVVNVEGLPAASLAATNRAHIDIVVPLEVEQAPEEAMAEASAESEACVEGRSELLCVEPSVAALSLDDASAHEYMSQILRCAGGAVCVRA